MAIWNPKYECISRDELEQLQLERLQLTLNRVYRNVVYHQTVFDREGIVPEAVQSIADLGKIPFTDRQTLRAAYPYDLFAVPRREVLRLQTSSGTTGEPIVVGYTRNDIQHWTELVARILTAAGITRDDLIQISFDYGLFPGALGMHYGAEEIGASVIPASAAGLDRQIKVMRDFHSTALIAPPSHARRLADAIHDLKLDPRELHLRVGVFGAEPWSENIRQHIEQKLKIRAFDFYGLSEMFNPGVAGECEATSGLHIFEDHFIPEIIEPKTSRPLEFGAEGELVLTSVTKEAFPMIRYRTGDITSLVPGACPCGRTLVRMSRVKGRTDDMFFVQGVNVFPSQVEQILARVEGTEPHFRIELDLEKNQEVVRLLVEIAPGIFFDEMKRLQALKKEIEEKFYRSLGLKVEVRLVEPRTLQKEGGAGKKVVDKRRKI